MWRFGFFFHEMAFGLLSVFIPLYVMTFKDTGLLGGPLVSLGIMISVAVFFTIPASFLWGYLCDAKRQYKPFILLSFLSSALILFLLTLPFTQNIIAFFVLYVLMAVLHVAHEAPKNVLIAEHYSRDQWEGSFGLYEGLTEIGFIIGLAIGLFAFASSLSFSIVATYTLYSCSGLSLAAFFVSFFLVADPLIIFERRLVGIERKIDYIYRGVQASSRLMDGLPWDGKVKQANFTGFAFAIVLFSLASAIFFTPLPVFLKTELQLSTSLVYIIYILNSTGTMVGYFIVGRGARIMNIRKQLPRFILLRSLLLFALVTVVQFVLSPNLLTGGILLLIGFAYSGYHILMLSVSMELIPSGKSGVFDVLVGLGAASGSFLGPFLAQNLNYLLTFLIAGIVFLVAFISIKAFG